MLNNHPAASCEVSNPRLRTAMARQFGGVDTQYLVNVLPANLRTTPTGRLGDAVAYTAFSLPCCLHIFANDFFIPMTAYGTDEIAFGPKLATPTDAF